MGRKTIKVFKFDPEVQRGVGICLKPFVIVPWILAGKRKLMPNVAGRGSEEGRGSAGDGTSSQE